MVRIFRSYFDVKKGLGYNFGRVPIAGTDFSSRYYTYDDISGDIELKYFNLTHEDYDDKIPVILAAKNINPTLKLMSAAWTAPPWMKSNNNYYGFACSPHLLAILR